LNKQCRFAYRIGHDNKGPGAGWHLESVAVQIAEMNKCWMFKCNRWLADNEDDNQIERDLIPDDLEHHNGKHHQDCKALLV
jgi:hypothetical protein